MQEYRFARTRSVYPFQPDDPQAVALNTAWLAPDENGVIDVTHRLQTLLDSVKQQSHRGVVLIPSGAYSVSETVYIPRAVRMIGFGPTRPKFILKANTPGFQEAPAGDKGGAAYMFWFTGNMPKVDGRIDDANPGTFYSALSNIDFEIQPGNPTAVAVRAHFAQHCFVSHCVFAIGGGKAGIYDVGNEMEDLIFLGGRYGIYTTKCSPGWPFALVESAFVGQRESAVRSQEGGLTFSHVEFRDVPAADIVMDGYYEKLFWKDCTFENISGPALQISRDESSMTQINLRNVWCKNVPQLLLGKETGQAIAGEEAPVWQAAKLVIPPRRELDKLPKSKGELATLITGLDCADAMVEAPDGSVYICDSRLSRIYRWDPAAQVMTLVTAQHHRPLSLGVDADGRLLVAVEYKPVKHSVIDGTEELKHDEFQGNSDNSSFYMFYKFNRRVRVIALDPKAPEASLELLPVAPVKYVNPEILWYPLNQWCDFGGIRLAFGKPEELCCPAPDGRTAVAYRPALSRATGLTPLGVGEDAYLVDEYNKCIVKGKVEEGFALTGPEVIAQRGEYGFALTGSGDG